jgi:hypothetical protein
MIYLTTTWMLYWMRDIVGGAATNADTSVWDIVHILHLSVHFFSKFVVIDSFS